MDIQPHAMVRQFSSASNLVWRGEAIELADVLTGGNGMGVGRPHWGIDLVEGRIGPEPLRGAQTALSKDLGRELVSSRGIDWSDPIFQSKNLYLEIPTYPLIDGVFIPTGAIKPMQISSAGHTFDGCPKTNGHCPFGATLGGLEGSEHRLHGDSLDAPSRSLILFKSNQGITIELAALRAQMRTLHPEIELPSFRTRIGFSDDTMARLQERGLETLPRAAFWVLVDGVAQFHQADLMAERDPVPVEVVLGPQAHFLTLMVTDGDHDTSLDRVHGPRGI